MPSEHPTPEMHLDAWLALTGQSAPPAAPVELPLLSGSMGPAIPVGSRLHIAVQPAASCRRGEVMVFADGDRLVAHRVLLVLGFGRSQWLLEKGDTNAGGRWRRRGEVRGRVVAYERPDGQLCNDPTDPARAARGLRRHLRHQLVTLGGLRSTAKED